MTILTESSNTVIHESGNKLYISKRPASWTTVFLFVTSLIAFILLANGLIQWFFLEDKASRSPKLGMIFIAAAVFFYFIFWRVRVYHKKLRATPPHELNHIVIIDFENNNLLDGQQNILTPLSQTWLTRKMQITSSSPELIIRWDRGYISIVKGNPFSGGIAKIEQILVSKGIRKA